MGRKRAHAARPDQPLVNRREQQSPDYFGLFLPLAALLLLIWWMVN